MDVSIQKRFAVTEGVRLEFRADFFNIANRANFTIPERRRGNSGFGRVRGTIGTGRQTQLGLRPGILAPAVAAAGPGGCAPAAPERS